MITDLSKDKSKNFWMIEDKEEATDILYSAAMERIKFKLLAESEFRVLSVIKFSQFDYFKSKIF